ncbi:WD_REPEATS_REGION domain-containing protein, partial [Haematococcus lacustris]
AGVLLALHPESGSSRLALNMNGLVPNGAKKQPKLYCVAVHPLQPQWVALATNTGTALLQLDVLLPLPAMALPLRSPLQAITSGGSGITFVTAMGDSVYCVTAALAAPPPALGMAHSR